MQKAHTKKHIGWPRKGLADVPFCCKIALKYDRYFDIIKNNDSLCNKIPCLRVIHTKGKAAMITMMSAIKNGSQLNTHKLDQLIEGIAAGDIQAFEMLYLTAKASVYSFALSILKNTQDAEDALHDCFVRIYSAAASYQKRGNAKAWIMTITYNLCMQKLRQRQKVTDISEEDWGNFLEASDQISPDDKIVLEQCMNALTDEERQIVVLHAVSGFKHREIAAMLSIPLPTVLSKYNRAIKKLQKALSGGQKQ